jgi:ATP-dependent DNA helicase RecG
MPDAARSLLLEPRPVTALKGRRAKAGRAVARLGIRTAEDVLLHLPLRYQDRSRITPISAVAPRRGGADRSRNCR